MAELPTEVADEAERLTRLARTATDPDERAARRERRYDRLAEHGFTARVREDPDGDVLVCYPSEWIVDGEVRTDRIEETDRAVERRLSGTEQGGDWEALATHNNRIAERVADAHGPVHGANARVFADFMSNHRARRVGTATEADLHRVARGMPFVTVEQDGTTRPIYQVGRKSFVFFRTPRPDAFGSRLRRQSSVLRPGRSSLCPVVRRAEARAQRTADTYCVIGGISSRRPRQRGRIGERSPRLWTRPAT